ncbi:MAG: DUF6273 domain-containing protein [Oscillospiraceae bacterium]|nr:DUF6273 domain-containing protein [Oscillospiraceae bacterium]
MKNAVKQTLRKINNHFKLEEPEIFNNSTRFKTAFKAALKDVKIEPDGDVIRHLLEIAICKMQAYSRLQQGLSKNEFIIDNLILEMKKYYPDENTVRMVIESIAEELFGYMPVSTPAPNTAFNPPPQQTGTQPKPIPPQTDRIEFGGYNWRVLDIQNDAALIITENIIDQLAYHNKFTAVTWADCDLRKYLNGEFLSNFSPFELAKIIPMPNLNPNNPWWGTNGGAETTDKVFLLSLQEVCRYFGDSRAQLNSSVKKSLAAEIKREYWDKGKTKWDEWKDFFLDNEIYVTDENNSKRMSKYGNKSSWWWLRSPGLDSGSAARVGFGGFVNVNGDFVNFGVGGVRPALWLNL